MVHVRQLAIGIGVLGSALGFLAGCASQPTRVARAAAVAPAAVAIAPAASSTPAAAPVGPVPASLPRASDVVQVPPAQPPPSPTAPAPGDEKPATITGFEESSAMLDSFTVFIRSIDGRVISAGRDGWNVRIPLKPGVHRIETVFVRGVFSAEATLELSARAGAAYQVRFATDAQFLGGNSYCEFWIVEAGADQPVQPPLRRPLTRLARSD